MDHTHPIQSGTAGDAGADSTVAAPVEALVTRAHPAGDGTAWVHQELHSLEAAGLRRTLRALSGPPGPTMLLDGRRVIVLGSNNYLDLAAHPRVVEAAVRAAREHGAGSGASRLVTGASAAQAELESRLAALAGTPAALLFSSGYLANVSTIPALVGPRDEVFSDTLNHASIIDGCRLSGARISVYPHRDVRDLRARLRRSRARRRLVVSDTLFSMEGDAAPVAELLAVVESARAMALLDESHAVGVLGAAGGGLVAEACEAGMPSPGPGVLVMGTLSKALGSAGGFVAGSAEMIELLRHRARGFVFDTAPAPPSVGAALAALEVMAGEPERRAALHDMTERLRRRLTAAGLPLLPGPGAVVPLLVGEPARAVAVSTRLLEAGVLAPAIRPPSVPEGGSRLRLTVSAGFNDALVDEAAGAIVRIATQLAP